MTDTTDDCARCNYADGCRRAEVAEAESREQAGELERLRADIADHESDVDQWEARERELQQLADSLRAQLERQAQSARVFQQAAEYAERGAKAAEQQLAESEAKCKAATALLTEMRMMVHQDRRPGSLFRRSGAFLSRTPSPADSVDVQCRHALEDRVESAEAKHAAVLQECEAGMASGSYSGRGVALNNIRALLATPDAERKNG